MTSIEGIDHSRTVTLSWEVKGCWIVLSSSMNKRGEGFNVFWTYTHMTVVRFSSRPLTSTKLLTRTEHPQITAKATKSITGEARW